MFFLYSQNFFHYLSLCSIYRSRKYLSIFYFTCLFEYRGILYLFNTFFVFFSFNSKTNLKLFFWNFREILLKILFRDFVQLFEFYSMYILTNSYMANFIYKKIFQKIFLLFFSKNFFLIYSKFFSLILIIFNL
jgi:hypothetical protein